MDENAQGPHDWSELFPTMDPLTYEMLRLARMAEQLEYILKLVEGEYGG